MCPVSESQMESRWEFTAPQFVDFAAIDLDDDLEEDKFFDVNNETRWCSILIFLVVWYWCLKPPPVLSL